MGYYFFWLKIYSKLNTFKIKKLGFLLEIKAILPETRPFLFAQMAVLSSFFQIFIVLGMYNFAARLKNHSDVFTKCFIVTATKDKFSIWFSCSKP